MCVCENSKSVSEKVCVRALDPLSSCVLSSEPSSHMDRKQGDYQTGLGSAWTPPRDSLHHQRTAHARLNTQTHTVRGAARTHAYTQQNANEGLQVTIRWPGRSAGFTLKEPTHTFGFKHTQRMQNTNNALRYPRVCWYTFQKCTHANTRAHISSHSHIIGPCERYTAVSFHSLQSCLHDILTTLPVNTISALALSLQTSQPTKGESTECNT